MRLLRKATLGGGREGQRLEHICINRCWFYLYQKQLRDEERVEIDADIDREKGNLFRALGRYNGSLGKAKYPNKVFKKLNDRWYVQ